MAEKANILVVDDERGIREGCRRILASEGFTVDVAENGAEGFNLVGSKPYDLILVDLMMPVMGGLDMMDKVREYDPEIIIIVITGFATIETAVDAMKHGAYDYLPKPFTPDQVLAVVNRGLEKRLLSLKARKLMEERDQHLLEVAREESKSHTIVNSMADGILVMNKEHQLVLWNPAAVKMLNLNGKLEAGKDIGEIIHEKSLVALIDRALLPDSSQYTAISEEIEIKEPEPKTLMINVSVIRDKHGLELGVVSTLRDITSMKELDQVKSQFISMVTHELRAPLSAVESYLSAYLSGAAGTDPRTNRQMLERAKARTHSLLDLVNDLLQFSRMENKRVERKKELLDVTGILTGSVELLKNRGEANEISFETNLPEKLPLVEADRVELEVLFTDLISNAINYNVKNGKVTISADSADHSLNIRIADTGIGIAQEHLSRIFDEFYRVNSPETRYVTGTGLGLSIVKRIVESHYGRIDVASEVGKGTTFTIKLPVKKEQQRASE